MGGWCGGVGPSVTLIANALHYWTATAHFFCLPLFSPPRDAAFDKLLTNISRSNYDKAGERRKQSILEAHIRSKHSWLFLFSFFFFFLLLLLLRWLHSPSVCFRLWWLHVWWVPHLRARQLITMSDKCLGPCNMTIWRQEVQGGRGRKKNSWLL